MKPEYTPPNSCLHVCPFTKIAGVRACFTQGDGEALQSQERRGAQAVPPAQRVQVAGHKMAAQTVSSLGLGGSGFRSLALQVRLLQAIPRRDEFQQALAYQEVALAGQNPRQASLKSMNAREACTDLGLESEDETDSFSALPSSCSILFNCSSSVFVFFSVAQGAFTPSFNCSSLGRFRRLAVPRSCEQNGV